ncbi:MAG: hypothetical protein K6D02_09495 [Lachnospiraceae bacterium]|nr:hypothetical protein [Lachnospiraceae bacterium]
MRKAVKKVIGLTAVLAMTMSMFGNVTKKASADDSIKVPTKSSEGTVYSTVYFGSYPQSVETEDLTDKAWEFSDSSQTLANGSKVNVYTDWKASFWASYQADAEDDSNKTFYKFEPLRWRVLAIDGDYVTLMSNSIIDSRVVNSDDTEISNSDTELMNWLNNRTSTGGTASYYGLKNFYMMAFNKSINGQNKKEADCMSEVNSVDGYKVSLLTKDNATTTTYGFASGDGEDDARTASMTSFASEIMGSAQNEYWLSDGEDGNYNYISDNGSIESSESTVVKGVRPIIKINYTKAVNDGMLTVGNPVIAGSSEEPSVSPDASESPSATESVSPTGSPDASASASPSGSPDASATVNPSGSPTSSASAAPSASASVSPSSDVSPSADTVTVPKSKNLKVKKTSVKSGISIKPAAKLTWKNTGSLTGVIIYRAKGKGKLKKYKTLGAKKAFVDKKVAYGKKYTYRVFPRYKDATGAVKTASGSNKKAVTIKTPKSLSKPSYTTKKSGGNLILTFKKVQGTNFQTQYKYNSDKKWAALPTLGGKVKKTIKKPLKATGFKIKIRTYMTIGKKKVYSAWVTSKTI